MTVDSPLYQLAALRVDNAARHEFAEFLLLTSVAVALPLVLPHSQPVTGVLVNAALAYGALHVRSLPRLLPLIVLPGCSALLAGVLFGGATADLALLLPAIWIGNALFVAFIKGLMLGALQGVATSLLTASVAKAGVILMIVAVLVMLGGISPVYLAAMAPVQLLTAVGGGLLGISASRALTR